MSDHQFMRAAAVKSSKAMLLGAAATLACLAASDGVAAESAPPAVGEVVVTGSRIARPEVDQPTPVQVLGSESFQKTGNADVGQVLAQQPAVNFGGTQQAQQNSGSATTGGLSLVNLRGLGTNRTLTLVNGKRQVGSDPGNTAFDLNSISSAAIHRVEVVTGGASAVYGSDAVTGVVNIITRDRFEGLEFEIKGTRSEYGRPGETRTYSAAAGRSFLDGRANLMATVTFDTTRTFHHNDQPDSFAYNTVANPAYAPGNGQPNTLLVPYVQSMQPWIGGVLNYNGTPLQPGGIPFDANGLRTTYPTALAFGTLAIYRQLAGYCDLCFNYQNYDTLVPKVDKRIGSIRGHIDLITEGPFTATAYADASYARRQSSGDGQPANVNGVPINVAQNPFLDPAVRTQLLAAGTTTASLWKLFEPVGHRFVNNLRKTEQFNAGVKGEWETPFADLKYDAYASYGQSRIRYVSDNNVLSANLTAALDAVINPATGAVDCRVNVPSLQPANYVRPAIVGSATCAPFNPFGIYPSQASVDFISRQIVNRASLEQTVAGLSFAGDTDRFLHLIGGAPVGFAAGVEYRKEAASFRFDPNGRLLTTAASGTNSDASFNVKEIYGELSAPILTGLPFAELLSVGGAIRYADYSSVGGVTSYKADAVWAPVRDLRFRGTISRAVRAPNITEAYSPSQTSTGPGPDPCTTVLAAASATRRANCTALGIPLVFAGRPTSIPLISSGNLNLSPEKADTYTVGVVATPSFLPGFSFSADYYQIKIEDAITLFTATQIAAACVDSVGGPDPAFCSLVKRDENPASPTYKFLESVTATYVNASKLVDRGIDFQASYRFDAFGAQMVAQIAGNRLLERRNYPFQSNPAQYTKLDGFVGNPTWKINPSISMTRGPLKVILSGRYFNAQSLIDLSPGQNQNFQDIKTIRSEYYQDVYVSWTFEDAGITTYGGATNLFGNKLPKHTASQRNLTSGYDQMGTVFFAGVKAKL
ncbi:TonB-dependent receptor [Phenylobacterium sp.]|uniref:TonB-dependent receptor plug domain-containing protein n=1 Tax=Phenylobacterium sp. TaxID=1871053 RepID=UPI00301D544F